MTNILNKNNQTIILLVFIAGLFVTGMDTLALSISIIIVFAVFYKANKSFLTGTISIIYIIIYVFPALIYALFKIEGRIFYTVDAMNTTLMYSLMYCTTLVLSYELMKILFGEKPFRLLSFSFVKISKTQFIYILAGVFIASLLAKYYLNLYGFLTVKFNPSRADSTSVPMLQLVKSVARYDIIVMLLLAYIVKKKFFESKLPIYLYTFVIVEIFYFAFTSGSRAGVIVPIILFVFIHKDFFRRKFYYVFAFGFFSLCIFKISGLYRQSLFYFDKNVSYLEAAVYFVKHDLLVPSNFLTYLSKIFLSRLDYHDVVTRTIKLNFIRLEEMPIYVYNLIGLIPRILWESKPIIGPDYNEIGRMFYVIHTQNYNTTTGLGVIGESYYQLGLLGLIVALAHGILLYIIDKKMNNSGATSAGFVIYPVLTVFIAFRDGFLAIIPGIVLLLFPAIIILWILNGYEKSSVDKNTK